MKIHSSGVSVLMTAYNATPYLEPAVLSILNQTLADFEFIIVNDGSTDQTRDYLDSITDPRVRVFHEPNRGTAGGSNFGLKYCSRKYIARMDADDISLPTRLEKQYQFMEANPEVSLVGSQTQVLGEKGLGIEVHLPTQHEQIFKSLMTLNHGIAHGSCFFRNSLLQELGGYWKVHKTFDDWDMFLRMGEVGQLANLPEILYHYRTLADSLVGSRLKEMRDYYWYSVDCSRRRLAGQSVVSAEEFFKNRCQRPWFKKFYESLEVYALNQYRLSTAEMCGGKKGLGRLRLFWCALCSPTRTLNRLLRYFSAERRNGLPFG